MRLYILTVNRQVGYDSYDSFVIRAENESEARELAAATAADEGEKTWLDDTLSDIEELHPEGDKQEIIVSSFNAG